jgi:S-DNA-T family DNA segregation ATPase FtsK/SpoIIIE
MYRLGFNRAARMIDQMQDAGIVSGEQGTKPRNVLVSKEQLEEILKNY